VQEYRIGRLKGKFVVIWRDASGRRRRYRLDARDARAAAIEAPGIVGTLTRPRGSRVAELWNGFVADRDGRAILSTMVHTWKALAERFGALAGDEITVEDCRAHTAARRRDGIKDGTIATELGHLRMVLRWAEKRRLIERASPIERPTPPKRTDRHLAREQCRALIGAATMPHVRLYIVLALGTGARNGALLDLTWDRCDLARGLIDLRDPDLTRPHKGRAIVPMNRTVRAALLEAAPGALSQHVIEWAGKRVASVKRGLKSSARAAGIAGAVSPHLLRHSAAVHMAEAGIPMEEIAQFLGHDDVNVTRRIYARFSPTYLRRAAAVLEYDDLGSANQAGTTFSAANPLDYMVGATGIEPVTPTMSTKAPRRIARK
jgi:site-specific recombinase XerD